MSLSVRPIFAALATAALVFTAVPAQAAPDGTSPRSVNQQSLRQASTLTLQGRGFGHGHGMSQYGAQGAALQGLTAQQIVGFYYPGTTLSQATGKLRVLITGDTTDDVVVLNRVGLKVRAVGSPGIALRSKPSQYRLVAAGAAATRLEALGSKRWYTVKIFAGEAEFYGKGVTRLVTPSGTYGYRGTLRSAAARGASSSVRDTVNVVALEKYLRGVVPREIPASWSASAVQAQAIAARTYAVFERANPGSYYDICDTTSCQVYGGANSESELATVAIKATKGQVVADASGTPAFTQFSASSGGWTSAGSRPYLVAQADPYDGWAGNPVHAWTRTLSVASIQAAYPTVGTLHRIEVTSRDGNGDWGGRVLQAKLVGSRGTVTASGDTLRSQFGLRSTWFSLG